MTDTDFETQLEEIDQQISNLKLGDTTDAAIASSLAALMGKRTMLLAEYGEEVVEGSKKAVEKHKETIKGLKHDREILKHAVVDSFNETAAAVKKLRDTEMAIKETHNDLQAVMVEINRTQGKPFQPRSAPAINYPAMPSRGNNLGALDAWYLTFAGHFGKLAVRIDHVVTLSKEQLFDVG